MSHVSSPDSLNGRRDSSDSGGPDVTSDPAGPRAAPERRGSGPGPVVARRTSLDTDKKRRSCSSEKETTESAVSNGCISRWSITH